MFASTSWTILLYLALAGPAWAKAPAGNENYASESRSLLESSLARRDSVMSTQATSATFTIGQGDETKNYLSPTGPKHKSYSLSFEWGLDQLEASARPMTVFTVDGEVTCDILGKKLADFAAIDDVFDPVSEVVVEPASLLIPIGLHARCSPPIDRFVSRRQRGSWLHDRMGWKLDCQEW